MREVLKKWAEFRRWYRGEPDPETQAKFEEVLKKRKAEAAEEPTERVWKRLTLYRVGAQIATLPGMPDCRKVEPTVAVTVPALLMGQLQEAVAEYPTGDQRVRTYR